MSSSDPSVSQRAETVSPGVTALHPETAIRTVRALAAMTVEFDEWMSQEIELLEKSRDRLIGAGVERIDLAAFCNAVGRTSREATILGYPLIAEICASLRMILEASDSSEVPGDVVDAHLETMAVVASDRTLTPRKAQEVVGSLTAAAAEFVQAGRTSKTAN